MQLKQHHQDSLLVRVRLYRSVTLAHKGHKCVDLLQCDCSFSKTEFHFTFFFLLSFSPLPEYNIGDFQSRNQQTINGIYTAKSWSVGYMHTIAAFNFAVKAYSPSFAFHDNS